MLKLLRTSEKKELIVNLTNDYTNEFLFSVYRKVTGTHTTQNMRNAIFKEIVILKKVVFFQLLSINLFQKNDCYGYKAGLAIFFSISCNRNDLQIVQVIQIKNCCMFLPM